MTALSMWYLPCLPYLFRRQNTYADIVAKSNTSLTELRDTHHATHNETLNQISQLNNKINDLGKIIIKLKEHLNRHIEQSNENNNAFLTHIINTTTQKQPIPPTDFNMSQDVNDEVFMQDLIHTQNTITATKRTP